MRLLVILFLILLAGPSLSGNDRQHKVGRWQFAECWPAPSGSVSNCVSYALVIQPSGTRYDVELNTDGFMAMQRIQAEGSVEGQEFVIRFRSTGPEHMGPAYRQGDCLLKLSRRHKQVITTWGAVRPVLPENQKAGVYFQK